MGLNYHDHAEEQNEEIPEKPMLFSKSPTSVTNPDTAIIHPNDVNQVDYEVELALGRRGPILYAATWEEGFESLRTVTYAAGRNEVRHREKSATDAGAATDDSSMDGAASGVLRSVRQLT